MDEKDKYLEKGSRIKVKILVVEDEKNLNHIIVKVLQKEGYSVDFCYDGESACDYLFGEEYDTVILDIMLPVMDGLSVLKKIRGKGLGTPILLLTAKDTTADIVEGLDAGADDYIVKPFVFDELLARVRVMVRKKVGLHENVYRCGNLIVDLNRHQVSRAGKEINLTPKEFSVLLYLIRNQNKVVSREQIEASLWDIDAVCDSNVIDVYIRYLRKKIDQEYEHKMIQTIRGVGYLLKSEE